MFLDKVIQKKEYIVKAINPSSDLLRTKFHHFEIIEGATIELVKKAPLFGDPLLFQVHNSQIAMTKNEASQIEVELKG